MNTFVIFLLIGFVILGVIHTLRMVFRLIAIQKSKGRELDVWEMRTHMTPLDMACAVVFGLPIAFVGGLVNKVLMWFANMLRKLSRK